MLFAVLGQWRGVGLVRVVIFVRFTVRNFFGICDLSLCSFMYDEYLGRILGFKNCFLRAIVVSSNVNGASVLN